MQNYQQKKFPVDREPLSEFRVGFERYSDSRSDAQIAEKFEERKEMVALTETVLKFGQPPKTLDFWFLGKLSLLFLFFR